MKKLKEATECKDMDNIKEVQDCYKRDYDKKPTNKICVMFVHSVMLIIFLPHKQMIF